MTLPHILMAMLLLPMASARADTTKPPSKKGIPAGTVRLMADIPYADTSNPRQMLDLLLPKNPKSDRLPIIVYVHGGAWRAGNKNGGRHHLERFVTTGAYAGVTLNYRLSQEARWPAQIHDCKAAIRWIRGNASAHGLDPAKIAVWGMSAGGHLASMLGTSAEVEGLEGTLGSHLDQSSRVTCVANYFGPSELLTMDDHPSDMVHNAPDSPESQLIGKPIQEHKAEANNASPIFYVTKDDAPFLHVHGDQDKLVPYPQSVALDTSLDAMGVSSLLITMADKGHGRFENKSLDQLLSDFFAKHLLGKESQLREQTFAPAPSNR